MYNTFQDVNSLKECLNVPQNFLTQVCISFQNLSYWNLNLFLDYFVIFDSGLGHSAILKQTLILALFQNSTMSQSRIEYHKVIQE